MRRKTYVQTRLNGQNVDFLCEPRQSLMECLRDVLHLTGTKERCNDGNCGTCTVLMDGRIVNSCLVLSVEAEGRDITTVEGVASPGGLHPIQQAFLENAAPAAGMVATSSASGHTRVVLPPVDAGLGIAGQHRPKGMQRLERGAAASLQGPMNTGGVAPAVSGLARPEQGRRRSGQVRAHLVAAYRNGALGAHGPRI